MHRLARSLVNDLKSMHKINLAANGSTCRSNVRTLSIGDAAEIVRLISAEDIDAFAKITGDTNPIHVDQAFGMSSRFGKCVVHGAFLNGIVSGVIGTILPGAGTIVVHQYLEFPNALFVGEEVKAKVEITLIKRSIVECAYVCEAMQRQKVVLKGYAKLYYRESPSVSV